MRLLNFYFYYSHFFWTECSHLNLPSPRRPVCILLPYLGMDGKHTKYTGMSDRSGRTSRSDRTGGGRTGGGVRTGGGDAQAGPGSLL